jgi:N-acetylmuramoyl-L-alanine amidase
VRSSPRPGAVAAALLGFALAACGATPAPVAVVATPAPRPTSAPAPAPLVVLDPGHNGGNYGAPHEVNRPVPDGRGGTKPCNSTGTQTDAGYAEHAFNWDVAQRVREHLVADGLRVVLTRDDDTGVGPCVDARDDLAEHEGAAAEVSIHADGAAPAKSGFHVAYSDPPLNPAQGDPSRTLATALRDAMVAAGFPTSDYLGKDGLYPRPDLAGLNLATRPTALIECANMRNAAEAALVTTPDGRERYAAAIATGIEAYLH